MNEKDYQDLIKAIDRSLTLFAEEPAPGFDLEVYNELRRVREVLIRARRDKRDPKIKRDSRSPLGSP